MIGESYGKVMQMSKKITNVILAGEYLSDERTRYITILSKEKEKAQRGYITALNTLMELKQPKTQLNIKTHNAYMSQYQQINTNLHDDDENIKD